MDKRTLAALRGSIEKWKAIVAGIEVDRGRANCQLCEMFYDNLPVCERCPVQEKTGQRLCSASPYSDWTSAFSLYEFPFSANTQYRKELASAELKFLQSLLPKKKKAKNP